MTSGICRSCFRNLRMPNHLLYFVCIFLLVLLGSTFAAIVTGILLFFFFLDTGSLTILVMSPWELKLIAPKMYSHKFHLINLSLDQRIEYEQSLA
mmetsp:Transcript_44000/g.44671  ORF Transcript_44000/g.44671 Transcript_44000/m.44671 type:complete len:95 (+) Transcript_44000:222-506(+)